jgi:hypothetical protein
VIVSAVAAWLALTPSTAEAQRGRMIARAAVNQYLGRGYGYGYGYGGYGYPRRYGGFTTPYGGGYGLGNSLNYGYPLYGYGGFSNGGYYGGRFGGGLGNGGYYGSGYGNAFLYGRGGGV